MIRKELRKFAFWTERENKMLWKQTSKGSAVSCRVPLAEVHQRSTYQEDKTVAAHQTDVRSRNANVYFDQKRIPNNKSNLSQYNIMAIRANKNFNAGEEIFIDNGNLYFFE